MPQRVRVPLRVIVGHYADSTVSVYTKIAALDRKTTGCEARVAYLSGLLGLARSTVESALTELMRPAPDDDVVELTSQQRTKPGGDGESAVRRIRATDWRREHGGWVPSRAAEALSPRQLRAYAALSYATATDTPVTLSELARVLRHRSGKQAGQSLATRSVRRILRDLEQLGWISVRHRVGYRGRNVYTCHDEPIQPALTEDIGEGVAGDLGQGSLASKEHHLTDSPDDQRAGGPIRRRRTTGSSAPEDLVPLPASFRRAPVAPQLTFAPRIWQQVQYVIEPVTALTGGLSSWVAGALAREIVRQLEEGQDPDRLRARLEFRFASTDTIRDPGRWLLGPALARNGCGLVACESGRIWHTGARCDVCAELRAPGGTRPPWHPLARRPERSGTTGRWHECEACRAPSREALPDGVCRTCRPPDISVLERRWAT
ncbi:hypothetical protein ACFWQ6_01020 [Streptomyces coelicoflavus]|uniref:hypothetical protein n=1 Tax=Streptomyces coelicoflavus TaxID=285562 RepID=UPI00365691ED